MLTTCWGGLAEEIDRWQQQGRTVEFWWRDDDAYRPSPALARLITLAVRSRVPLALAVVPHECEASAFSTLDPVVAVIQHGVDHRNRAGQGQKKNEFPDSEPLTAAFGRLAGGLGRLRNVVRGAVLPVLAPPWNRLSPALVPGLAQAGYAGLTTFGPRSPGAQGQFGLARVNTHVDLIDWKAGRGFCGAQAALAQATRHLAAKRTGSADPMEPTGWLTHHAVHDEAAWDFLQKLFEETAAHPAIRWRRPASLFDNGRPGPGQQEQ